MAKLKRLTSAAYGQSGIYALSNCKRLGSGYAQKEIDEMERRRDFVHSSLKVRKMTEEEKILYNVNKYG